MVVAMEGGNGSVGMLNYLELRATAVGDGSDIGM
jgi:hypothetical protein